MARTSKRAKLAAFGNPLVDIIVSDEGGEVTEKYNLQINVAQEMDTVQSGILQEISARSELGSATTKSLHSSIQTNEPSFLCNFRIIMK